ncbi:hypothetical protein GW17_00007040 [Ensete ventricosum]|nr:hypothetical protein GW17_00007040 [Ensete ventricosum]
MAGQSDPHLSVFSPPVSSGDFGPFRPNIASEVPLWLAVALKKRGKCDIRAPDWIIEMPTSAFLTSMHDTLRCNWACVGRLAPHIVILWLFYAVMIIQVRSLIEDIRDVRFHKVETGLQTISGRTHAVKVYIQ